MKVEKYIPSDILKPFIKTFMIIDSESGTTNRILPDTSIVMAFRYKGKITCTKDSIKNDLPNSVITGLRKSFSIMDYSIDTAALLVIFKEGGAPKFFREPLHELFGASVSLDNLIARQQLQEVEEQLAEAQHNSQRISTIEQFLISKLNKQERDVLIMTAIQKIQAANGNIRIRELVAGLPVSRDPFEKRFRQIIGTTPKQFSATVRFRNFIHQYSQKQSLTSVAFTAGYFDQAHFIKDFKLFTGETPRNFFKSSAWW